MILSALKKARRGISKIRKALCFDSCYYQKSYSQEGEDIILSRLFEGQKSGFYVDVGAHHPKRFSNTYLFYKRGWRGINIDAMPGSMTLFKRIRPLDINLELAIGMSSTLVTYYMFNEPALNTFSENLAFEYSAQNDKFNIVQKRKMDQKELAHIFERHLPEKENISFMNIDVEGMEIEVLKSNDWSQYRPKVILVEMLSLSLQIALESEITRFLKNCRYGIFAKTVNTFFFMDMDSKLTPSTNEPGGAQCAVS